MANSDPDSAQDGPAVPGRGMIDILYSAHARPEFTRASLETLIANTPWEDARLIVFTDGAAFPPECFEMLDNSRIPFRLKPHKCGGPVGLTVEYVSGPESQEIFAKIDNDVIVPPGWLDRCRETLDSSEELDLLGIEPWRSRTPNVNKEDQRREAPELSAGIQPYAPCRAVGGIGLFRRRPFERFPGLKPEHIYGGFTGWQAGNESMIKGWIVPPLKVFLLDRMPIDPWSSLSKRYVAEGVQRPWTNYGLADSELWSWWTAPCQA